MNELNLAKAEVTPLVSVDDEYNYSIAPLGKKVVLLTLGRIAVIGDWKGSYGEFFIGWHELPKRNKTKEHELGLL